MDLNLFAEGGNLFNEVPLNWIFVAFFYVGKTWKGMFSDGF